MAEQPTSPLPRDDDPAGHSRPWGAKLSKIKFGVLGQGLGLQVQCDNGLKRTSSRIENPLMLQNTGLYGPYRVPVECARTHVILALSKGSCIHLAYILALWTLKPKP